jgi:NCAIR mutase (PurE)-related protein
MTEDIEHLLEQVKEGTLTVEQAAIQLKGYEELGFAKVDHRRKSRQGFPEVIYAEGKTKEHVLEIFKTLQVQNDRVLATRVDQACAAFVLEAIPETHYNAMARTLTWMSSEARLDLAPGYIAVVCAGTSDLPVAEEAVVTCEALGYQTQRVYDVGVAGIHRLFNQLPRIEEADVIIVVAGMEGALASVVGGLVSKPIIAVPTSVGYGANFQGLSALLTMLNSCASGVSVVNIDNGFGAGYSASLIMKNKYDKKE